MFEATTGTPGQTYEQDLNQELSPQPNAADLTPRFATVSLETLTAQAKQEADAQLTQANLKSTTLEQETPVVILEKKTTPELAAQIFGNSFMIDQARNNINQYPSAN